MVWNSEILRLSDFDTGKPWPQFARAFLFGPNVADLVADFDFCRFLKSFHGNMLRRKTLDSPILQFP